MSMLPQPRPQIWMCLGEDLAFEDCDQACPGPGCHNVDCSTPMLYPGTAGAAAKHRADCTGAACWLRDAAGKARSSCSMMALCRVRRWQINCARSVRDEQDVALHDCASRAGFGTGLNDSTAGCRWRRHRRARWSC